MAEARGTGGGLAPVLWLAAVLGALLAGGLYLWTQDTRRGALGPHYSVRRTDERGAALVFRLFERAGLRPRVWDRDLGSLSAPGLLVFIAPERAATVGALRVGSEGDLLPHELQALDAWVRQGNTVVVMSRDDNSLYREIGLFLDSPERGAPRPAVPLQPTALASGVRELSTATPVGFKYGKRRDELARALGLRDPPGVLTPVPAGEWVELFARTEGDRSLAHVVAAARGRGLYVAVADALPAGNAGIGLGDNARFMLNLASLAPPGGAIWFDEYHKRSVDRGMVTYLRERSLLPALVYLVLLMALAFWRTGSRFGPAEPLAAEPRRDSADYVRAAAALYRSAGMAKEALGTLYADFRRRLAGTAGAGGGRDLEEIGRVYEQRAGRPALEARQVMVETEAALARERLEEADALQFAARLAEIDAAVRPRGQGAGTQR